MGKIAATRQSAVELLSASKKVKRAVNATWALAPKAPMFTRKSKSAAGKKKITRTNRLVAGHAFKIVASGAAQYTASVLSHEAGTLRVGIGGESKRCPWLPSFSKGALAMIEGFLCAYAQESTRNAVNIRKGLNSHKRLNGKLMKLGYDAADAAIFGVCAPAPRSVIICKPEKRAAPGKKGEKPAEEADGDYAPPPEADAEEGGD